MLWVSGVRCTETNRNGTERLGHLTAYCDALCGQIFQSVFFFLSSSIFLLLTLFSSDFSHFIFLYLFSATRHYIPKDCNSHRQSCEFFSSEILIFWEYYSSYIHLSLSFTVLSLLFPSSLSFFPRLFLLLLPL